ncbi:MAG: transcription-repair coupling factor [Clostridia bacterium]|nr:transcription-repair coupling factor [Clostridia bacterium]
MNFDELLQLNNLDDDLSGLYSAVQDGRDVMVFSAGEGEKIHISSHLGKFVLFVAKDAFRATTLLNRLKDYFGERVAYLPANEELLLHRATYRKSILSQRIDALYKLASGKLDCLVVSPQTLTQYLPTKQAVKDSVLKIKRGDSLDMYDLIDRLALMGYTREEGVEEKSTFSVAGDIIRIFPPHRDLPIRISFFDDEVENIKEFAPDTLMSVREIDEVNLMPDNDLLLPYKVIEGGLDRARRIIDKLPSDVAQKVESIYSSLCVSSVCTQKMQWLLPFVKDKMHTVFDYLDENCVVVFDEPSGTLEQLELYVKEHLGRVKQLSLTGEVLKEHSKSLMSVDETLAKLRARQKVGFNYLTATNAIFSPEEVFNISCKTLSNYTVHYDALLNDLRAFDKWGYTTLICMGDEVSAKTLRDNLISEDIGCSVVEDIKDRRAGIFILSREISKGFLYTKAKVAVIGREDISRVKTQRKKDEKATQVFTIPKVGDYVVHEVHGIGKCLGTKYVTTGNISDEYIVIEYRNHEILYVPTDKLDRLSRYTGSDREPKLSLIGGKDFDKIKQSVKASVKEMAVNLLELYSQRQSKQGYKYAEDDYLQKEFEDAFEYTPTDDQVKAVQDIKSDMQRGVIMDRLLCGDVGYGKTEVALRAIFKTICHNKQAVILCPTTILARQHYNTAKQRFKDFGINVELISRLQSTREVDEALGRLAIGKSLIAVGTHRMLSQDVHFHDLGLIVLDEEQRFGVEHKEKLKLLKNNVNVLTMSATPIPRTLNMAMTGIRDISVLETPPSNRLPVQTYVCELSDALITDAVNRELARGGQVFILYNRVKGIENFAKRVSVLAPEAKVDYAHGQMSAEQLEDKIGRFYAKEYDVLVSTTIIENGIDIPDANTLIVCEANRLGLSQMYQLRGRVGRSNRIAYTYFTVKPDDVLTTDAYKRLSAILDYTELGSGFKIAMRDLEIRGAGNILGKEQHGHIEKVGYDMYCKLLREAVDELQGVSAKQSQDVKINHSFGAYIDKEYVADEDMRMRLYRKTLDLTCEEELDKLKKGVEESYGAIPTCCNRLFELGLIRNLAKSIGIKQIDISQKTAHMIFADGECFKDKDVMLAVQDMQNEVNLTYEECPKLQFECKFRPIDEKLDKFKKFLLKCGKSF